MRYGCTPTKGCIGFLPDVPEFYGYMNAREYLTLCGDITGIDRKTLKSRCSELLELVGLDKEKHRIKGYSRGMKQRLGIALALLDDPDLVLLDEPINGLDPQGIAEMRDILIRLNRERGITIIISSHILAELAKLATDYAIIDNGKIIEESTNKELREKCRDKIVIKTPEVSKTIPIIDGLGFKDYSVVNDKTIHVFDRLTDITVLNMELAKAQIPVESIGIESSDLEEYFLKVTGTIPGERR